MATTKHGHEHEQHRQGLVIPRNDLAIRKSYAISVVMPANVAQGNEIYFGVNNVLNPKGTGSVIFTGLECYINTEAAFDASGNPVFVAADATQASLTLVWEDVEFLKDYPYNGFNTDANFGMIRRLNHVKIDLTKSYVKVLGTTMTAGNCALLNFFYQDMPEHHGHPGGPQKK